MSVIKKINELPQSEFVRIFANIFENASWIAEDAYSKKPFSNFEDLSQKIINIFSNTTKENQLKIIRDHPDLADKTKITSLSPDSLKEQKNSGLDNCTKEEFDEFSKLNNTYKKFGFPFILAIKGKTKIEILNNFRKRISFDSETEFKEALKQVKKIALLRLEDLKNKDI